MRLGIGGVPSGVGFMKSTGLSLFPAPVLYTVIFFNRPDETLNPENIMKILIIGGGGREHALAWKIAQSPQVTELFCAPGNPGTAQGATNLDIPADDFDGLLQFALDQSIDHNTASKLRDEAIRLQNRYDESEIKGKIKFNMDKNNIESARIWSGVLLLMREYDNFNQYSDPNDFIWKVIEFYFNHIYFENFELS